MARATRNGREDSEPTVGLKPRRRPRYIKPPQPAVELGKRGEFECKWCHRVFSKETIVARHLCEQRRRWEQKDTKHARYGLEAYLAIQKHFHRNATAKTEEDFRHSDYYLACLRWGRFVIDINCLDVLEYLQWLLRLNIPIDRWNEDAVYDCYLQDRVFAEDAWDALAHSILTMVRWSENHSKEFQNYFRQAQTARIITDIRKALISGWLVFCSTSGQAWLGSLEQSDLDLVWAWLDVSRWNVKFERAPDTVQKITAICTEAGL